MLNKLERLNTNAGARISSGDRSPLVRKLLCAVFVVLSLVVLWLIVQSLVRPSPVIASGNLVSSSTDANPRWNWFLAVREEVVVEVVEPEEDEELALASIRAELLGVVISEKVSFAAISTAKDPQGLYSIGDEIESNVTLEEIEKNRVIISQRGARRQILLNPVGEEISSSDSSDSESLIQVTPSSSSSGFNLSGLMSTTPVQIAGGGIGLKLGNLSDDLTDLADVREDDVVLSVNGTPISDMLTNPLLWQQFSQQTNMPLTVLRDGEEIDMYVNAASLSQKILPRIGAGLVQ